jgi:hypothetical protein
MIARVPKTTSLNGIGTDRTLDKPQRSSHIPKTSLANVLADLSDFLHFVYCVKSTHTHTIFKL